MKAIITPDSGIITHEALEKNEDVSCGNYSYYIKRGVITYPKSISDIRKTYPKVVSDLRKNFFSDIKTCHAIS